MKISIIIPVYNEKDIVATLLSRVLTADTGQFSKEIIVVDDGSTDGTQETLAFLSGNLALKIITHPSNLGKAAAIKSALTISTGDIILIQDADLEYSPDDYRNILRPFVEKGAEVVYGSRFLHAPWPHNMRPLNWLANKLFTGLTNILYRARLTDEGTAYKAFRKSIIDTIDISCSGFEFCPEVTAKILKRHIPIIEVPIAYKARTRKEGKKPRITDGLRILWTIIKYRFMQ